MNYPPAGKSWSVMCHIRSASKCTSAARGKRHGAWKQGWPGGQKPGKKCYLETWMHFGIVPSLIRLGTEFYRCLCTTKHRWAFSEIFKNSCDFYRSLEMLKAQEAPLYTFRFLSIFKKSGLKISQCFPNWPCFLSNLNSIVFNGLNRFHFCVTARKQRLSVGLGFILDI